MARTSSARTGRTKPAPGCAPAPSKGRGWILRGPWAPHVSCSPVVFGGLEVAGGGAVCPCVEEPSGHPLYHFGPSRVHLSKAAVFGFLGAELSAQPPELRRSEVRWEPALRREARRATTRRSPSRLRGRMRPHVFPRAQVFPFSHPKII